MIRHIMIIFGAVRIPAEHRPTFVVLRIMYMNTKCTGLTRDMNTQTCIFYDSNNIVGMWNVGLGRAYTRLSCSKSVRKAISLRIGGSVLAIENLIH